MPCELRMGPGSVEVHLLDELSKEEVQHALSEEKVRALRTVWERTQQSELPPLSRANLRVCRMCGTVYMELVYETGAVALLEERGEDGREN